nr:hypothetical protein [Mycoplasmopsis bovis]
MSMSQKAHIENIEKYFQCRELILILNNYHWSDTEEKSLEEIMLK